ncbi:MAG TPA: hemerythrin domain-containing protein [Anaeromyxobacter sp.]|nr:hemerythrin domain-containing protein [Anaeromyxobacter sp.]
MDAIETLMTEHRLIKQVLDALVGFAQEAGRTGATEQEELGRFVTFFREFADACHHGKEEDVLFTAMTAHGFPSEAGPIAVMLHEHDQGRALVTRLAELAGQAAPWSAEDLQSLAGLAGAVSEILHAHIHQEDAILYPMAEQRLPAEALEGVSRDCERFEAERAGAHERLHALAEGLVARHAHVAHPAPRGPQRLGCCA